MNKALVLFIIMLSGLCATAQQTIQFTHYMYNTLAVNPGYAGSRGMMNITALHRSQWIGIDGAPTTQTFFIHSPLRGENIALGLSAVNDKIGPINNTSAFVDFSYTIKTTEIAKLSFGLKAGANMLQGDLASLATTDPGDQSLSQNIESAIAPNFGFGVYYHTEKWYAGASAPTLLESEMGSISPMGEALQKRHYYVIGGLIFPLSDNLKLKPTLLSKLTPSAPLSIDLTCQVLIHDKLWTGLMHRWQDSFGVLVGYQFSSQLRAGYSYDYTVSPLGGFNSGSHEAFISFDFLFKKDKMVSPRYF